MKINDCFKTKLLSVFMSIIVVMSVFSVNVVAKAEDLSLTFDYVHSGQISWNTYTSYSFYLDSYSDLSIDFDCSYDFYGADSPKILIIEQSKFNDWKIGKDVDKKYYTESSTSNNYDYWCDGVASLSSGNYQLIIDNRQGWGYYDVEYSINVSPIVTMPNVTVKNSCNSVKFGFKTKLGTQEFRIEQLIDNKYSFVKNISADVVSTTINDLEENTAYKFRIRGSSIVNGKKYNSEWKYLSAKTCHTVASKLNRASINDNGRIVKSCSVCGKIISTTVIAKASNIKLSATGYTYDGNYKKPTVTVKDSKGNKISTSNYSVTYSNNKYVGKASVKVTFKGNYSGTKTLYFTINPKGTTISSLSGTTRGFKVSWKKQATQTTGYQIQYSTSSKFTNPKTVTVSKNSTTSKSISKLTAKKKYYVRVRTYKTVNGTKYYSAWSSSKSVITKK